MHHACMDAKVASLPEGIMGMIGVYELVLRYCTGMHFTNKDIVFHAFTKINTNLQP